MESIEFKNLRAIKNSGELKLSNLNLFLGANSTGKSTILRFFPLIRQTLFRNNHSPLLWYDAEGVDFGSFKESVYSKDEKNVLSFAFSFKDVDVEIRDPRTFIDILDSYSLEKFPYGTRGSYRAHSVIYDGLRKSIKNIISDVSIKVSINKDRYTKINVKLDSQIIEFNFERSYIKINGEVVEQLKDFKLEPLNIYQKIVPEIVNKKGMSGKIESKNLKDVVKENLSIALFKNINRLISEENRARFVSSLKYFGTIDDFKRHNLKKKAPKTLHLNFEKNIETIYKNYTILTAISLMSSINEHLEILFKNISYIAPVRATAERYYRIQGLSVLDVDSTGANVPMILHGMTHKQKNDWKNWTKKNFNIEFETFQDGGHIGINVKNQEDSRYNLADTGFGYSQILPVLLVIWKQINRRKARSSYLNFGYQKIIRPNNFIVIEQPELHLHPAMQAQIADLLVTVISNYPEIQFIIETHSIVIMNRIGQHIEKNNQSNNPKKLEEKINIFLVNPLADEQIDTNITKTSYDSEGIIQEWPVGFLSGGIL